MVREFFWNHFEKTGEISSYLTFKECCNKDSNIDKNKEEKNNI